ncbi:MAG: hypothetical protein ACTSRS_13155 [Candidatus Helarchaeota archaeon]
MPTYIRDLTATSKGITITVKLVAKQPPRYAKGYKITTFLAADPTGEIPLPFWNNDGDAIHVGDVIRIENGYTSTFQGRLQLNIGKYGSYQPIDPPSEFKTLSKDSLLQASAHSVPPQPATKYCSVADLLRQSKNISICVYIKEKLEEREVHVKWDGHSHRVVTYLVGDSTGCIYLQLWDEWNDLVHVDMSILITAAYVRSFRGQRFLNLSRRSTLATAPTPVSINLSHNFSIENL